MFKKTKRFLLVSMSCLVLLCVLIFIWLSSAMTGKSEEAINEVGKIYMSEMSMQLQQKFDAITTSWISQVEGIIRRTPPEENQYGQKMLDELALGASVRGFEYLGLYTFDGECEDIYGGPVSFYSEEEFQSTIEEEKKIISGYDAEGEKLLFLTIDAEYPMKGGKDSDMLVAGLPMSQLEAALVLYEERSMVYTHIVRKDGGFVVRSGEAFRDNYFDRLLETISSESEKSPEEYIDEIQTAMEENGEYSALVISDDTHRHIYCAPLSNSDWYLVSVMPYGVLDDAIMHLSDERQKKMLTAGSIILAALLLIFIFYYRMSQQQLVELDKAEKAATSANKAKSEFLSSMSHDIRTPMNGIVGMTAIAIANIQDTARVQDCLKKISLSSRHLLGLINDVLDMSKIESGKLSLNIDILSLRDVMENIVNIIQPQIKERRQHFDIFIENIESEEVCCDGVRLNQVLVNLLSNAIKFTPEEGTINVYLYQEASPAGDSYVRCHFRVKDNGIGMSQEFQRKIFETFSREDSKVQKIEGTGLGMAITKFIVGMMDGTIEVESEQGKGSEFHVTIDLERATIQDADIVLPPWRLLVVDNNEDLCRSAASVLKGIGVQAEWVLNGREALQKIEENHRKNADYEIILLDWKMPDMNGLETTRGIRKIVGDDLPILIISAYDWSDIEEEARAAGAQGFISKPLFKSNLYLGLSRYVEGMLEDDEQETNAEKELDFGGLRILLAEDNDLNWEIAEDILTDVGFEVEWAENGQICVDKFKQSELGYYDAVLMDIRMPVMNGYDAAKAIRALDRPDARLPIIAMTADAFSEDIQRCLECGMNEHVAKPIDIEKLMKLLKRYLG
ncbi:MAG: response regulator [Dorea sp.]|nr:response regulator [Dorea sp.]